MQSKTPFFKGKLFSNRKFRFSNRIKLYLKEQTLEKVRKSAEKTENTINNKKKKVTTK